MANLPRKLAKIFGGSLAANPNVAVFGSLKAGTPTYSLDLDTIQSAAWLQGWLGAIINAPGGLASPALQDMAAAFYVLSAQIAYLTQKGMPDWLSTQEYFIDDFVKVAGVVYISKTNNNTGNNPVSDTNNWKTLQSTLGLEVSQARAWVCFDGRTGAIESAHNVSSVTRTAAGAYVLNFTTPLPNASYAFAGSCGTKAGTAWSSGDDNILVGGVNGRSMIKSTTQLSVFAWDGGANTQDASAISVQIFGTS